MAERLIVTGEDKVRALDSATLAETARISLTGSVAVCHAGRNLFVSSSWGDVIWRLDAVSLVPTALFAGGPGVSRLMLTPEGRLLALCADADSLMLMTQDGAPQVVNRAGVNPRSMALSPDGRTALVSGGVSGEALIFDAANLSLLRAIPMPGLVHDAAYYGETICTLVMTETLDTLLCLVGACGHVRMLPLSGMPGAIAAGGGMLLCQAGGRLYRVSAEEGRVIRTWNAPGRAERMLQDGKKLLMLDSLTESLLVQDAGGEWRRILTDAADLCV